MQHTFARKKRWGVHWAKKKYFENLVTFPDLFLPNKVYDGSQLYFGMLDRRRHLHVIPIWVNYRRRLSLESWHVATRIRTCAEFIKRFDSVEGRYALVMINDPWINIPNHFQFLIWIRDLIGIEFPMVIFRKQYVILKLSVKFRTTIKIVLNSDIASDSSENFGLNPFMYNDPKWLDTL